MLLPQEKVRGNLGSEIAEISGAEVLDGVETRYFSHNQGNSVHLVVESTNKESEETLIMRPTK